MATITQVISSTNNDHGTGLTVYTTLALWEAGLPSTFGSDSYVGEIYNEGTEYGVLDIAGQTIGSNTLTLKCAAGQSFRDHASAASNALFYDASKGVAINGGATTATGTVRIQIANVTFDGLQIKNTAGGYNNRVVADFPNETGVVLQNSILENNQTGAVGITARKAALKNCLLVQYGSGGALNFAFGGSGDSVTVVRPGGSPSGTGVAGGYGGAAVLVNCAVFGFSTSFSSLGSGLTSTYTATDGTAQAGTGNVGSLTYTSQFVSTTNDFRLKAGASLIDAGATALTTDIIGQTRPTGSADDIGAWEYASGGATTSMVPRRGGASFRNLFSM
jgi:hypothetical protein